MKSNSPKHSKEIKGELATKGNPIQSGYISEKGGTKLIIYFLTLECSRTRNALCLGLRGEAQNETKVSQHQELASLKKGRS